MPRDKRLTKAKEFAERAEKTLEGVTDQGAKAQTLALLALTHAVLETGYDIDNVREAIADKSL
ncbi:hypothetical protein OG311_37835 (plasmid) [Streptomyces sp. NBC_01343]|uniref:hypothetical protein n=1 Tax=Streptomyces sp. NBC_01343 TaxID=2903832 RepID=UPI002E11FC0A|nr:hypothetical protein OG311_37835 [Streptomyces sp. NBC_01343]